MASCTADYISIGYRPFDENELRSDEIAQNDPASSERAFALEKDLLGTCSVF